MEEKREVPQLLQEISKNLCKETKQDRSLGTKGLLLGNRQTLALTVPTLAF